MSDLGRPISWFHEGWAVMPGLASSVSANWNKKLPARHYWRESENRYGQRFVISACGRFQESWMDSNPPLSAPGCPRCKNCLAAIERVFTSTEHSTPPASVLDWTPAASSAPCPDPIRLSPSRAGHGAHLLSASDV